MAGTHRHPFTTLPHGFHFHYTEGTPPKTPERDLSRPVARDGADASTAPSSPPTLPPPPPGFRVRRRIRPRLPTSGRSLLAEPVDTAMDVPLPSIETPDADELTPVGRPLLGPRLSARVPGLLSPLATRSWTAPRTPLAQKTAFGDVWTAADTPAPAAPAIVRPTSVLSTVSDSSDESDADSDRFSYGGSCTSPESDAPDPFIFPSPSKGTRDEMTVSSQPSSPPMHSWMTRRRRVHWTSEMDQHIWSIYLSYLQDPTVTPFKTLPGSAPPLGVCHRISREARRTWRPGRVALTGRDDEPSVPKRARRDESPDTITVERSGSLTPTHPTTSIRQPPWPKSGSATRRRLRELCKRKATIAPHYQRLLKSKSPSPFHSSSRPATARPTRLATPMEAEPTFATRDVQIALATSTSTTMQPDGPLAQLARPDAATHDATTLPDSIATPWVNHPASTPPEPSAAPWASPPIPSDVVEAEPAGSSVALPAPLPASSLSVTASSTAEHQLGSPFAFHTWGPSHSRHTSRPSIPRVATDEAVHESNNSSPRLRSPVQLHATFPANHKRRAPPTTDDDDPASHSGAESSEAPAPAPFRRPGLEDLFGGQVRATRRRVRVRSRGFSLGDALLSETELAHHLSDAPPPLPLPFAATRSRPGASAATVGASSLGPSLANGASQGTASNSSDTRGKLGNVFGSGNGSEAWRQQNDVFGGGAGTAPTSAGPMKQLGSPFAGISSRPARARGGRHAASASLGFNALRPSLHGLATEHGLGNSGLGSIDQMLLQHARRQTLDSQADVAVE